MKKILLLTIIVVTTMLLHSNVKGQFVLTAMIDTVPTEIYHMCKGDTLDLNSVKSDYLMNNDFNTAQLGIGWSMNIGLVALYTNPCAPTGLPASGATIWFGGNAYPRNLVTVGYDVSCYSTCYVEFDMKYGANQNSINCESPDIGGLGDTADNGEGVHLLYSANGGLSWTQFTGIDQAPTGVYGTPSYVNGSGGYWTPVAGNAATGPYYTWNHYRNQLPATAISSNMKIRWYQNVASGNQFDHWGIDNVQISCPTQPYLEWRCIERPSWHYYDFDPPPFIADQEGTFHYIVSIIDLNGNNNCTESDTITVIVHDPIIDTNISSSSVIPICDGDSVALFAHGVGLVNYEWNTTPVINNDTIIVSPTTTTLYTVTAQDSMGCITPEDSILVIVNPFPVIDITNDTICINDTAMLVAIADTADTYLWTTVNETTPSILVSPSITTAYGVEVTTPFGCVDSSSATAVVNPLPVIQLTPNTTICRGNQATLTANGGDTYLWNTATADTTPSITVSPVDSITSYKVIVTTINDCIDSASVDVSIIPLPLPTISQEIDTLCKGAYTTIIASGGTSYLWNTGQITPSIYVRPLKTIIYNVMVSNSLNGVLCSENIAIQQTVRNCNVIYIPNSFSPSGYNTVFKPIGEIVISKTYQFAVYNRWGQMVFETKDINQGWDGRFNGKYVPAGAYIYYLRIDNGYEDPFEKIGTVTIIE